MSQEILSFPLWNGNAPFTKPEDAERKEHFCNLDIHDGIDRMTDVTNPTVTWYPAAGNAPHPAVLVCPGGGYSILAWNHEGRDIATMLNQHGFTAFLLKYRVPDNRAAAHADAARAMRFIRANAEKFEIIPDKVGAIGFSAGGHLAATLTAPADDVPYPAVDAVDEQPWRSNFTALIYPAYLSDLELNLEPEFKVDANASPVFIIQAEDDCINVENGLAWYLACRHAGIDAEMHLWAKGGHGYGVLRTGNPIADWPVLAGAWFRRMGGIR